VCGQVFRRLVSRAHGSWSVRTTEPHGRVSGSQSKKAGSPGNFRARQDRREASVSAAPRAIVMARIERDKNETIQVYLLFIHSSVYIRVWRPFGRMQRFSRGVPDDWARGWLPAWWQLPACVNVK
jgi:hypothetical protein